jgi:hypothetical protein
MWAAGEEIGRLTREFVLGESRSLGRSAVLTKRLITVLVKTQKNPNTNRQSSQKLSQSKVSAEIWTVGPRGRERRGTRTHGVVLRN